MRRPQDRFVAVKAVAEKLGGRLIGGWIELTDYDVLLILGFLWRIDPRSDWKSRADRLLSLLMDGLRAGAPGPAR